MSLLSLAEFTNQGISKSETLFLEPNISGISINMATRTVLYTGVGSHYWYGSVKFKTGDLSGSKDFHVEGKEGMIELIKQMENFIKTL